MHIATPRHDLGELYILQLQEASFSNNILNRSFSFDIELKGVT